MVGHLSFVLSCATSSLAVLALFVRYGSGTTTRESQGAWASLGANAYGVYLLHYFAVAWLQLALLGPRLAGVSQDARGVRWRGGDRAGR